MGNHLLVKVNDPNDATATDQITVENWFTSSIYQIEQFTFADGTSFANTSVAQRLISLYGTASADSLAGNANDNLIDGAAGADMMAGADGNDVYYVDNVGDIVTETVSQGTDAAYSDINYTLPVNVEQLILTGSGNLNGTGNTLDNVLIGNGGSNSLTGAAGNDSFIGGVGSDTLMGGAGNDTYLFAAGDGADLIVENDATVGNLDVARFAAGIAIDQIWLSHIGNDLEVSIIGTADKVIIQNWYLGGAYHVEQFKTANDKILTDERVENLVQLMGSYAPPSAGQTTLPQNYQDALLSSIVENWF